LVLRAEIAPGEKTATSSTRNVSNCFQSATRADFVVDGRKLLGAAQCRKNGAILQHGSLLLDADETLWTRHAGGSLRNVVTLKSLGVKNSREEIVRVLCEGVARSWNTSLRLSALTPSETKMANFLSEQKYATEAWNRRAIDASNDSPERVNLIREK